MKQKKIPLRKCTGCGEMKPKRELVRVVKAPDQKDENGVVTAKGQVSLDITGKKSGRGAVDKTRSKATGPRAVWAVFKRQWIVCTAVLVCKCFTRAANARITASAPPFTG